MHFEGKSGLDWWSASCNPSHTIKSASTWTLPTLTVIAQSLSDRSRLVCFTRGWIARMNFWACDHAQVSGREAPRIQAQSAGCQQPKHGPARNCSTPCWLLWKLRFHLLMLMATDSLQCLMKVTPGTVSVHTSLVLGWAPLYQSGVVIWAWTFHAKFSSNALCTRLWKASLYSTSLARLSSFKGSTRSSISSNLGVLQVLQRLRKTFGLFPSLAQRMENG